MKEGEVVICGSVVPPIPLTPGNRVRYELSPQPAITVSTAG
jgi:2-keto-4-pentenoate hydratase